MAKRVEIDCEGEDLNTSEPIGWCLAHLVKKKEGFSREGAEAQPSGRARGQDESGGGVTASPGMMRRNDDPTLTSSLGPLPPLPRQFIVTATGAAAEEWPWPEYLGMFTSSERFLAGKPVYINSWGMVLYRGHDHRSWMIGKTVSEMPVLRGSRMVSNNQNPHRPESEDTWIYWTGSQWKPASVTVTATELPLARKFTVMANGAAAVKYPSCLGEFTWSEKTLVSFGKPVYTIYTNTRGMLLYYGCESGWVIGNTSGGVALRGSYHRPESGSWLYFTGITGSEWKPASVTVIESG